MIFKKKKKKRKEPRSLHTGRLCVCLVFVFEERQFGTQVDLCSCATGAGVLTVPGSLSAPEVIKKRTDTPVQTQRQEQK